MKHKDTLAYDPGTDELTGTVGSTIATYDYDALGRRVRKMVVGEQNPWKYFYYDGHRVIEQNEDGPCIPKRRHEFVFGLDYIDEPVAQYHDGGAEPYYVLQDANFNVIALTDSTGALEQQYAYRPYGERLAIEDGTGAPLNPGQILTLRAHQGLWEDRETGTYYTPGRIYIPRHGRWLQRDPNETGLLLANVLLRNAQTPMAFVSLSSSAQYADSMSLYQYVSSNPINRLDPTGQFGLIQVAARTAIYGAMAYAFIGAFGGINAGIDAYGQGLSPREIVIAMLQGAKKEMSGYERAGAILLFSGIAATGPVGLAAVGGLMYATGMYGMYEAHDAINDAQDPIELAQAANEGVFSFASAWLGARLIGRAGLGNPKPLLERMCAGILRQLGPGRGAGYGKRAHTLLKQQVRALGRPDLWAEVSYKNGRVVTYGTPGSIRPDVVYGTQQHPTAIYDLKTGTGKLTSSRIAEIRRHLPKEHRSIPIEEIRGDR